MKRIFLILAMLLNTAILFAQKTEHRNLENKLAIQGYDPVSYLEEKKAVKGKKELSVNINGAIYYTSSEKNKQLLKSNPAKYEPAYGGWCAFAMGDSGEKVEIDPETFKIVNGRLHLFYNKFFKNTLKSWNKNEVQLKKNADLNWKKITEK